MELTLLKYHSKRCQVTACNNRTKQLLYRSEYHKAPPLGLFCLQYILTTLIPDRLDFCDITVQGVPKVRSSNFMHYNFWSKLYFYMKLLEDVYFSIKYMYSEFQ